jgi:hypothetical protein
MNWMMLVVLIAGIALLVAGLVTAGLGIELDLSFGNTLLLAGVIVACTGVLMLGLWIAVRELKAIAWQLSGMLAPSRADSMLPSAGLSAEDDGFLEPAIPAEPAPSSAPPWHEEAASRDRGRGELPPRVPEAPPAAKPRRNLLFPSSSRKERERAQARESSMADPHPGAPGPASREALPPAESSPAPPATFDDGWPKLERTRVPEGPRRGGRVPSTFTEAGAGAAGADRGAAAAQTEDQPQVTVLKSGVVDGMAYSLYSDGSIEAQMPEGMMRFASIDELRAHLDQRP